MKFIIFYLVTFTIKLSSAVECYKCNSTGIGPCFHVRAHDVANCTDKYCYKMWSIKDAQLNIERDCSDKNKICDIKDETEKHMKFCTVCSVDFCNFAPCVLQTKLTGMCYVMGLITYLIKYYNFLN